MHVGNTSLKKRNLICKVSETNGLDESAIRFDNKFFS
jgi:hypothetical protein